MHSKLPVHHSRFMPLRGTARRPCGWDADRPQAPPCYDPNLCNSSVVWQAAPVAGVMGRRGPRVLVAAALLALCSSVSAGSKVFVTIDVSIGVG